MRTLLFPYELQQEAFSAANGEFGWMRSQVPGVVAILADHNLAILGGELWWVLDRADSWNGLIPQRKGPDAVYHWETQRQPNEFWVDFVKRCAAESLAAVANLPAPDELPMDLPGRIVYNLSWVSETEYHKLTSRPI